MEALVISNVILWCTVVVLSAVVFALARQLGVLHERLAPVGALATASPLEVGAAAPRVSATTIRGEALSVGTPRSDGVSTLLFFLSPTCPVCETLLPTLLRIANEEGRGLQLVLASDGAQDVHESYVVKRGLESHPYVLSTELGLAYHAAKLPYAVLIDAAGIVRAKGLVNTREHVESLFAARDLEVASIQDFVARHHNGANAASNVRPI